MTTTYDVLVIGAGQAGLAAGYYLRRTDLRWAILDAEDGPGAAWRHGWDSLRLFSPAQWSSLPGWAMPPASDGTPTRDDVIASFAAYEERYQLPIERPVHVRGVQRAGAQLRVKNSACAPTASYSQVPTTSPSQAPRRPRAGWPHPFTRAAQRLPCRQSCVVSKMNEENVV